jgi:hypothetical protein
MKSSFPLSLDVDLVNALRARAAQIGVPYSQIANLLLTEGLASRDDSYFTAKIRPRSCALQPLPLRGALGNALALLSHEGWTTINAPGKVLWRSLEALQARSMVESEIEPDAYRLKGIPLRSRWRRTQ